MAGVTTRFLSLDGGVAGDGIAVRLDRRSARRTLSSLSGPVIARGAGLSFAAASFGAGATVADAAALDAVLDFDPATRIVTVEAGVTLGTLHRFLIGTGHYLPVQPGYSAITVGGCVAADVHGKNPARDGTFHRQVAGLTLFHPDHGTVTVTADDPPGLLALTCGGFGLTGVILSVRLRVQKLPGAWVESVLLPVHGVADAAATLRHAATGSDFAYAWLDLGGTRRAPAGFVSALRFAGDPARPDLIDPAFPHPRLTAAWRARLPCPVLFQPTIRLMNAVHAGLARLRPHRRQSLGRALFTFNGHEFYHALFGRAGFHEAQVIVPDAALPALVDVIRSASTRFGTPITLAAGKAFAGAPSLLRFDGSGMSLAVNLRRGRGSLAFLAELDAAVIGLGGRPNLIKDSRLPRAVFEATVPAADQFRSQLRAWDPGRRFRSELSDRLGL